MMGGTHRALRERSYLSSVAIVRPDTWKDRGKSPMPQWPDKRLRGGHLGPMTTGMVSCIAQGYSLHKNKTDNVWQETRK